MNPWTVELILARDEAAGLTGRRSLARDVEHEVLFRVRRGVYVLRSDWTLLDPLGRHIVAMRALAAVSARPPIFSHWSAAAAHGLPFMWPRRRTPNVTLDLPGRRGASDVSAHVLPLQPADVVSVHGLLVTSMSRTVIDIAAASAFREGVVVADGALAFGLPREMLEAAVDLAGPRRGMARAGDAIAFAHPGGESPNESMSRTTMFVLGVEPPELQHEVWDRQGLAGVVDDWWDRLRAAGEADRAKKYLDPKLAPAGAGRVVYDEKKREDRVRAQADGFVRWGWEESCSPPLLRAVLARIGVVPLARRPTLADWAALARAARPRRPRMRAAVRDA